MRCYQMRVDKNLDVTVSGRTPAKDAVFQKNNKSIPVFFFQIWIKTQIQQEICIEYYKKCYEDNDNYKILPYNKQEALFTHKKKWRKKD